MRSVEKTALAAVLLIAAAAPAFSAQDSTCITVLPVTPVAVAPNQPPVAERSTKGIINALCDVTLNLVGCGFTPTSVAITCDVNGDGVGEAMIPLKQITVVNRLLVQATLPALAPQLAGSPFPLSCCGGSAVIVLTRTVSAGDDNALGAFTQTLSCPIDLGLRAPVVISVTPSGGDCDVIQNLQIPGSCFLQPDGTPNVTSVFAVERVNPHHVIQATRFVILSPFLIDAVFDFRVANAGRTFLIFVSGPNGTSRNLTELPAGASPGCPLGNEQGVVVTFTCNSLPNRGDPTPPPVPQVFNCKLDRDPSGAFKLNIIGRLFTSQSTVTINGVAPKKLKFKDPDPSTPNNFFRIVASGKICDNLPGFIVVTAPLVPASQPFFCGRPCPN